MSNFKIPKTPSSTNKGIRFPNDVIDSVEKAICGKDCTFSAFVIAAVRAALADLEEQE
ncbi:MAG: YlcI/YnfO family protein [Oscillibacter sp.]